MFSKLFSKVGRAKQPRHGDYDDAKHLARDDDEKVRADLARRTDLPHEILYFLAEDPSPKVRRNIASNAATPRQADLLLANDSDVVVRGTLAQKIGGLAPGLSADEKDRLRRATYDALSMLARDQAVRVRQIIAETLKEVADAPPDVIRRLAWDVEAAVATPVLRFSPVLTETDLIEIIRAKPSTGAVSTISQRQNVTEALSDAIVDSDDGEAIALLLGNESAQIREETLDRVIDQAIDLEILHLPLAMRPRLRPAAAVKIARFVAEDILKRMAARDDLPTDAVAAVRDVVHKRLGDAEAIQNEAGGAGASPPRGMRIDDDAAFDMAARRWADGELDEAGLLQAVDDGETTYAMAIIAVMGDVPLKMIKRACSTQSAKGCTALSWRAGLSAKTAEVVQQKLALIPPREILRADGGVYPLSDEDLAWHIDFIRTL